MTLVTFRQWLLAVAACGATSCLATAYAREPLYVRLGGEPGVAAIVDALIDRAVADPVMGPSFEGSNLRRLKGLLTEQVCDLSGGPCTYSGDSMKEVHEGHHISQAQFYRMVETLRSVLKERGVDQRSTNELLRLLAPTKRDVVEPPANRAQLAVARSASGAGAP